MTSKHLTDSDLQKLERASFRAATDTGLWDILLAAFLAQWSIAPLLSNRLGDFWSSAVFVPVWVLVFVVIRRIHHRLVVPRVGVIQVGPARRAGIVRLSGIMLGANIVALAAGIFVATRPAPVQSSMAVPLVISIIALAGFSLAAHVLTIPRLFVYGLLVAGAAPAGELLFRRGLVSHHGFPAMFGLLAVIVLASGLVRFWRVVPHKHGEPTEAHSSTMHHD